MKKYKNIILLRDSDDGKIDLIILTNENSEKIKDEIDKIEGEWYEREEDYSLTEKISEELKNKFDVLIKSNFEIFYY